MGVANYLIEGVSGTGKTTVAEELQRRGFDVIHGDRQLAYYGDPKSGTPMTAPSFGCEEDAVHWGYMHWIWPVDRVRSLIGDHGRPMTFFCGHSANAWQFINRFDKTFVLAVDPETLQSRLARRPEDEFGGKLIERALISRLHASGEGLPENAELVDATPPVSEVVDNILSRCNVKDRRP